MAGTAAFASSTRRRQRRALRRRDIASMLLLLLAVWQGLSWWTGSIALASPSATFARLAGLVATAAFWSHAAETFAAVVTALLISGMAGLALGIALGAHRFSGEVAEPLLVGLYTLPKMTLYPIVLMLFGLGMPARVAFGTIHGLVPVALFAMNALRVMPPVLLRTARVFQLSPMATVRTVILPAVLPELATGLRVGTSLTLLGVLIGEMFASQRGLGFLIANAVGLNDTATVLAATLLVAAVAVATNTALLAVEHRLRHPA